MREMELLNSLEDNLMTPSDRLDESFFLCDTESLAKKLIGCILQTTVNGEITSGVIVETEAYHQREEASHSFRGKTKRNAPMFCGAGHAYVYFIYGMHYCFNVVSEEVDIGAAVLIRAVAPVSGSEVMLRRRDLAKDGFQVTNGPSKLCQAMGIDLALNGENLRYSQAVGIYKADPSIKSSDIISSPRIGISKAQELEWRFYLRGCSWVSKP